MACAHFVCAHIVGRLRWRFGISSSHGTNGCATINACTRRGGAIRR